MLDKISCLQAPIIFELCSTVDMELSYEVHQQKRMALVMKVPWIILIWISVIHNVIIIKCRTIDLSP